MTNDGAMARPAPETIGAHDAPEAAPFLKWAGGKGATADRIIALLPRDARERFYREPFLGGGAVFFRLRPRRARLSDAVGGLAVAYRAVRDAPGPLLQELATLRAAHGQNAKETYYRARDEINMIPGDRPSVRHAALFVYLNKTCFNGLYRTNRAGLFNVPMGRYQNPGIVQADTIRAASAALRTAVVGRQDYAHLLDAAVPGDLIYMDPPYVPTSRTSSFTAYAGGAWASADHERLAEVYRALDARGCLLALSNSDTLLVRRLYEGYDMTPIVASRSCGASSAARGAVTELLIRNVDKYPR